MTFDFSKVRLNWYPYHMQRAMYKMDFTMKKVDFIIEVRDARIPITSINEIFNQKYLKIKKLIVFNKTDLAAPEKTAVTHVNLLILEVKRGYFRSIHFNTCNHGGYNQEHFDNSKTRTARII